MTELTAKEFILLSKMEQKKRYRELSIHELIKNASKNASKNDVISLT